MIWLFLKICLNAIYFLLGILAKANWIWQNNLFTFSQNGFSISLLRVTPDGRMSLASQDETESCSICRMLILIGLYPVTFLAISHSNNHTLFGAGIDRVEDNILYIKATLRPSQRCVLS